MVTLVKGQASDFLPPAPPLGGGEEKGLLQRGASRKRQGLLCGPAPWQPPAQPCSSSGRAPGGSISPPPPIRHCTSAPGWAVGAHLHTALGRSWCTKRGWSGHMGAYGGGHLCPLLRGSNLTREGWRVSPGLRCQALRATPPASEKPQRSEALEAGRGPRFSGPLHLLPKTAQGWQETHDS